MRKLSQINEGLWKSNIERVKSGEKRIGERMVSNIKDMVAIDVGMKIEFANIDLEIDGEDQITWPHLYSVYDQILKFGWRLPTESEVDRILNKFTFYAEQNEDGDKSIYIKSKGDRTKNINARDIKVDMCVLDKDNQYAHVKYWYEPFRGMREEYASVSPFKDDNKDWTRRILSIQTFLRWGTLRATSQIYPDKPETMKCRVRLVRDKRKKSGV